MPQRDLNHTGIRIGDLDRSRKFYEGLLGLSTAERPDLGLPGVWYSLGGAQLHLIQNEPMGSGIDPTAPHFALEVDDLDDVRERLRAAGLEIFEFGAEQLWVRDPDGNTIELRSSAAMRR